MVQKLLGGLCFYIAIATIASPSLTHTSNRTFSSWWLLVNLLPRSKCESWRRFSVLKQKSILPLLHWEVWFLPPQSLLKFHPSLYGVLFLIVSASCFAGWVTEDWKLLLQMVLGFRYYCFLLNFFVTIMQCHEALHFSACRNCWLCKRAAPPHNWFLEFLSRCLIWATSDEYQTDHSPPLYFPFSAFFITNNDFVLYIFSFRLCKYFIFSTSLVILPCSSQFQVHVQ